MQIILAVFSEWALWPEQTLLFLSQPSLVSHDSDTVPAVYSKSNTISLHLHCFSLTSKNEHACLFLGPNLKMLSIAFVRLLKMLRCGKKSIRCLWPLTQLRNKAFKSVRCPATCRSTDITCRHSLTTLLIKISSAWKRVCNLNVTIKVKHKSQDSKSSILHS